MKACAGKKRRPEKYRSCKSNGSLYFQCSSAYSIAINSTVFDWVVLKCLLHWTLLLSQQHEEKKGREKRQSTRSIFHLQWINMNSEHEMSNIRCVSKHFSASVFCSHFYECVCKRAASCFSLKQFYFFISFQQCVLAFVVEFLPFPVASDVSAVAGAITLTRALLIGMYIVYLLLFSLFFSYLDLIQFFHLFASSFSLYLFAERFSFLHRLFVFVCMSRARVCVRSRGRLLFCLVSK